MWICNMYYLDFFNVLCQRTRTKQDLIIVNFTYYCTIFKDKRNYVVLLRIVPLLTHALSTNNSFLYITKPIIYGWWIEQCPIMIWLHQSNHQKVERWDPRSSWPLLEKNSQQERNLKSWNQSQWVSRSESRDVMFEIQATILNPVCSISKISNVRTMLFIPRERAKRLLQHSNYVKCLWVKQKDLLAEVFIVYERATTKKLLFNRRNGYPQTYLYYYYLLPPIKVLRIKLLLSWFPVYYPVTKNVRVSWKILEKERKGPRYANFTQKFPTYG